MPIPRPALIACLALAAGLALGACSSSSTSRPTTPTSATSSPTTVRATAPAGSIWPPATSELRFTDAASAARSFATGFLHFPAALAGGASGSDASTVVVPIRPSATGPVTDVSVRRASDGASWWVTGAMTASIAISDPVASSTISSPVAVSGTSTAFEAQVVLELRVDGSSTALSSGTALGGSNGTMGPYSSSLSFSKPSAATGAIVVFDRSAKDGSVLEAAAIPVDFGG